MEPIDLLPDDRAFTWAEAKGWGLSHRTLKAARDIGLVRGLFKGLFIRYDVELTVDVRVHALARVLPSNAVATDETAAWIHGVDLFVSRADEGLPRLQFFLTQPHNRLRNGSVDSGSRQLEVTDVRRMGPLLVTTPLRTALDLVRLRKGPRALASIDGLLRLGEFTLDDAVAELERFKGFRGVIQARTLVPLGDPRSDSVAESSLRYAWVLATDLPRPRPQLPVENPFSPYPWFLDLAVEELRYAAEYDGVDFHSSPEHQERDLRKRRYLAEQEGWTFDIFTKEGVFARNANPLATIRLGILRARRAAGRPRREYRWPSATVASRPWGREDASPQRSWGES